MKRKCVCGRGISIAGPYEQVRALVERFAKTHEPCCRANAIGAAGVHRCVSCGQMLLFGDRCIGHPNAERIAWHEQLEEAFAVELGARRRGEKVPMPAGRAGDLAFAAFRHADRPGWDWLVRVP